MAKSIAKTRIQKELSMFIKSPTPGISCACSDDSMQRLNGVIIGAPGTPFDNGMFNLDIQIPERYPFEPPSVRFVTPIYHPNVDTQGRICLDTLKLPPLGSWKPHLNLSTVLMMIRVLMAEPGNEDPLMANILQEYKYDYPTYLEKAKQWTKKYATGNQTADGKIEEQQMTSPSKTMPQGVAGFNTATTTTAVTSKDHGHLVLNPCTTTTAPSAIKIGQPKLVPGSSSEDGNVPTEQQQTRKTRKPASVAVSAATPTPPLPPPNLPIGILRENPGNLPHFNNYCEDAIDNNKKKNDSIVSNDNTVPNNDNNSSSGSGGGGGRRRQLALMKGKARDRDGHVLDDVSAGVVDQKKCRSA